LWIVNGIKSLFGGGSGGGVAQITSSSNPNRDIVITAVMSKVITVPVIDNSKLNESMKKQKESQIEMEKAIKDFSNTCDINVIKKPTIDGIDKSSKELDELIARNNETARQIELDIEKRKLDREKRETEEKDRIAREAKESSERSLKAAQDAAKNAIALMHKKAMQDKEDKDRNEKEKRERDEALAQSQKRLQELREEREANDKKRKQEAKDTEKFLSEIIETSKARNEELLNKRFIEEKNKIRERDRIGRMNSYISGRISTQKTISDYFNNYSTMTVDRRKLQKSIDDIQHHIRGYDESLKFLDKLIEKIIDSERTTTNLINTADSKHHMLNDSYVNRVQYNNYLQKVRTQIANLVKAINTNVGDATSTVKELMWCAQDDTLLSNIIISARDAIEYDGKRSDNRYNTVVGGLDDLRRRDEQFKMIEDMKRKVEK